MPGQRLESFSVLSRELLLSPGNTLMHKRPLSFAPLGSWNFTVRAKYAAKRELKLEFYVFTPDKIVWSSVKFTPDTAFAPIPRTQAVLRVWREYPRRAPWGWALRQMDGLEDTSESLSWDGDSSPPGLLNIKLYDGTRIDWLQQRWIERVGRTVDPATFCQTPLRFLGLCY